MTLTPREKVLELILAEIGGSQGIPFRRFMEMALYSPGCGYYEVEAGALGKEGDFYTSVTAGPLFGELLGYQIARWLEGESGLAPVLVEVGAHNGQLASDILSWVKAKRAELYERIRYQIIEPSETRQKWQRLRLVDFAGKVEWGKELAQNATAGVIFSNELFDALPVSRFGWDRNRRQWYEWNVRPCGEGFEWVRGAEVADVAERMKVSELLQLQEFLPDGFSSEQAPAAAEVFGKMSNSLAPGGRVVVIDYGLDALEFFKPERSNGTLRGYRAHKMLNDPLAIPGEQDLTAQVNFTVLREAGGKSGLRTEMYGTQEKFLTGVIQDAEKLGVAAELIGGRYLQARTLLHPQHMGRSFRVLVQQRPM